jgi:Tfp pilus assembly protein PilN
MNFDWITTLLPIINATGIPLLSIGIIFLLRAYQKSVETYKDTTAHLKEENKRVREQLSILDSSYADSLNKMRETVSKSMQAIGELQAEKISILTNSSNLPVESVQSDIEKIDDVLDTLSALVGLSKRMESYQHEMDSRFTEGLSRLGKLITQIGDTKSRLAIVRVLASNEVYESISSQVSEHNRGLQFSTEKKEEKESLPYPDELMKELEKSEANSATIPELPNATSQKEKG